MTGIALDYYVHVVLKAAGMSKQSSDITSNPKSATPVQSPISTADDSSRQCRIDK